MRKGAGDAGGSARRWSRLDADVSSTLAFRAWTMIAGAGTLVLVPAVLGAEEQGYYYTFASLLALQIFFELGMGQVILQLVSHDVAQDGKRDSLAALVLLLHRWYAAAAVLFFFVAGTGGAYFLARDPSLPVAGWLGAWLAVVLATAINLFMSCRLAIVEGSGDVAGVARLRLGQSVLGHSLLWGGLAAGAGLWAMPLLPLACAICSAGWTAKHAILRARATAGGASFAAGGRWRQEVFPLQWRLALSWIAGYFCFQLLTPIAFAKYGAVEAGRLGITLAVFQALLSAGMSWVNAKFPALSMHLARSERPQANRLFLGVAVRATAFTAFACAAALVGLALLLRFHPDMAHRFASLPVAACIAVVTVVNTVVFAAAAYLRAHKEEPMLWVSLAWAAAIAVALWVGSRGGVLQMVVLYTAATVLVPLPWTILLFRSYYRRPA